MIQSVSRLLRKKFAAELAAVVGLLLFVAQSFQYALTSRSSLDEGLYLFKGLLFVTGVYRPYQEYGVLTNKTPLAFLIPGYVQQIFGVGLRSERYFSIVLGTLAVIGLWIAAHRLGTNWLAAAAVWAVALNPALIGTYSVGITQVIIACMLSWMLVFGVGEERTWWQLALAGLLAGLMFMTRHNTVVVLPLLVLYVLWQHGWKSALIVAVTGGSVVLIGLAAYWPNILYLLGPWLPGKLSSFLDPFASPNLGVPFWDPEISLDGRVLSTFQGFRFHFLAMAGSILALILWPKASRWKDRSIFRIAVFLGSLFFALLLMHFWAAILNNYCVFCFVPYLGFYNMAGLLFLVVMIGTWEQHPNWLQQVMIVFFALVVFTGVGFSAFEDFGEKLLALPIPWLRAGGPGTTTLWEVLSGKYDLARNLAKRYSASVFGLFMAGLVILLAFWIYRKLNRKSNFGLILTNLTLILGFVFSLALTSASTADQCRLNVLSAYEQDGAYLASIIPPGSLVYWDGGLSVAPLLYVPGVRIFPGQLNQDYAFRIGGDPNELSKYGLWNEQLAEEWRDRADFIIVEEQRLPRWKDLLPSEKFKEYPPAPQPVSCSDGSQMLVFQRKP